MNLRSARWITLAAALAAAAGCKKATPVDELEKTAAAIAAAKPEPGAPADPGAAQGGAAPADQVKQAIEEYKAGKMEDAVTRLHLLRDTASLSPQQRMALQDSMAAVMTEIYTQAEKGDPRAIAAVKQYEKMQTGGH